MRPTRLEAYSTEKMPNLEGKGNSLFSSPEEEKVFNESIDDDGYKEDDFMDNDDFIRKHFEHLYDVFANVIRSFNDPGINRQIDSAEKENIANYEFLLQLLHSLIDKQVSNKSKHVIMECAKTTKEVNKWKQKYYGMKGKYEQITKKNGDKFLENQEKILQDLKKLLQKKEDIEKISLETIDDYLNLHLKAVARNKLAKGPEGYRYPVECHILYVLLSFAGKSTYELLVRLLHLPSYKQVKHYQKELLEKYKLNGEHPLDGSPEIINELSEALWDNERSDKRSVLAIDAASINPQISISENGKVTGFTSEGPQQVTKEQAKLLRESRKAYTQFIKKYKKFVSKYEFVVLLCPLDPNQPTIPISCVEANSGTATQEIKESLEQLRANAEACGFEIVGYAFDGDRQYLDLTEDFINEDTLEYLWGKQDLSLSKAWEEYEFLCLFYDLLHLVKCDRYRKAKNNETCIWPTSGDSSFSKEDFIEAGIQPECFIDSRESKMHDDIPLKLFTPENCHQLFALGKYDLCLSLLPSTYIIEAVMNEKLTREERIQYLTIGFCIVALFYDDAIHRLNECQSYNATEGSKITLFNLDYCKKYLALCWSLSQPITEHKCVRLGSLGTHMLEHLFGYNRRMSRGDDTGKNFQRIIKQQLLSTAIEKEMNLNLPINKRHHSSGAICDEIHSDVEEITLKQGFIIAAKVISLTSIGEQWGAELTRSIIDSLHNTEYNWDEVKIKDFLPSINDSPKQIIPSLKNIGASLKGGLSNLPRYSLHKQFDDLFALTDDEDEIDLDDEDDIDPDDEDDIDPDQDE